MKVDKAILQAEVEALEAEYELATAEYKAPSGVFRSLTKDKFNSSRNWGRTYRELRDQRIPDPEPFNVGSEFFEEQNEKVRMITKPGRDAWAKFVRKHKQALISPNTLSPEEARNLYKQLASPNGEFRDALRYADVATRHEILQVMNTLKARGSGGRYNMGAALQSPSTRARLRAEEGHGQDLEQGRYIRQNLDYVPASQIRRPRPGK